MPKRIEVTFLSLSLCFALGVVSWFAAGGRAYGQACVPTLTGPVDSFFPADGCPGANHTVPVENTTKTSTYQATWPDGYSAPWMVTAGGQCLLTQPGCCQSTTTDTCYPEVDPPVLKNGLYQATVVSAGVTYHGTSCTGTLICAAYLIFDSCNVGTMAI
jgi:hypothetical protein